VQTIITHRLFHRAFNVIHGRIHKYSGSVGCFHLITYGLIAPVRGSREQRGRMRGQGNGGLSARYSAAYATGKEENMETKTDGENKDIDKM